MFKISESRMSLDVGGGFGSEGGEGVVVAGTEAAADNVRRQTGFEPDLLSGGLAARDPVQELSRSRGFCLSGRHKAGPCQEYVGTVKRCHWQDRGRWPRAQGSTGHRKQSHQQNKQNPDCLTRMQNKQSRS